MFAKTLYRVSLVLIVTGCSSGSDDGANMAGSGQGGTAHGGQSGGSVGQAGAPNHAGNNAGNNGGNVAGASAGGSAGGLAGSPGGMSGQSGGAGGGAAGSAGGAAGSAPPTGVPMFIATGRGGRRLTSCDDGMTWMANCATQGFGSGACKVNDDNGDHEEWSSHNVAYHNGVFMALYGWFGGQSAHILRTRDGRQWDHVFGGANTDSGTWGNGIAAGNGVFAVNAQRNGTHWSDDEGANWTTESFTNGDRPHRRSMMFIPYQGGRFLSYGDNNRVTYSDDNGLNWTDNNSNTCPYMRRFAWGNDRLVAKDSDGLCVSTDGGLSWTVTAAPEGMGSGGIVFTGDDFYVSRAYTQNAFRSADGTSIQKVTIGGSFGGGNGWPTTLARGDSGTLVAASGDGSTFYRSTDGGQRWSETGSHAGTGITGITFGYGTASADCPAP